MATVAVRSEDREFFVEVVETARVTTVGVEESLSFDGVRETIEAIGSQIAAAWDKVLPNEAVVEFGLKLTAKSGRLTGLVVEGGGEASLRICMTWKRES